MWMCARVYACRRWTAAALPSPPRMVKKLKYRAGFRLYWRWKSRSLGGRPKISGEIRPLIRELSLANRLWGAPASMVNC